MICPHCKKYFKSPGQAKGGSKAKHTLSREQALRMVAARDRNRPAKKEAKIDR